MKKLFILCSFLAIALVTPTLSGQKDFAGTIKMKTYADGTTDPNILSQIKGEYDEIVLGSQSKIVYSSPGGIGQIVIKNGNNGIVNLILDLSAMAYGKYLFSDTADRKLTQYDYDYDDGDTKEIAGYSCKKVTVTMTNLETDETESLTLYVTKDLMNPNSYKSYEYPGLKGFPLYTAVEVENAGNPYIVVLEASEVIPSRKIKPVDFMIPAGCVPIADAPDDVKAMLGIGLDDDEDE